MFSLVTFMTQNYKHGTVGKDTKAESWVMALTHNCVLQFNWDSIQRTKAFSNFSEFFHNLCHCEKWCFFAKNTHFYTPSSAWNFIACLAESFQNGTWVHIQLLFCSCHFIFSEWKKMAYLELQLTIQHYILKLYYGTRLFLWKWFV